MTEAMHPLLARQLRKVGLTPGPAPDADSFARLLDRVGRAYADSDQGLYLLERSQNIASREMADLNEALQVSQARLTSLLSLSSDWVWEQDVEGRFTFVSEGLAQRTGLCGSLLLGQRCDVGGALEVEPDDHDRLRQCQRLQTAFQDITFSMRSSDGRCHHMRISGEPVFDGRRMTGFRGVGRDVTGAVSADRRIQELVRYDSLTGLPNRRMFMESLEQALARNKRHSGGFIVLFIDLDRFKAVNDNLGHGAGDALLCMVSERLRLLLREADVLSRLGGDEFIVLTEANPGTATAAKVATRIIAALAEPMCIEGRTVQISASVGISVYPDDGADAGSLIRSADAAMYHAKARGKNTFEFFTEALARRSAENFSLEADMRLAVDRNELVLHYQPQVDAADGSLIGVEALLRWQHPTRGLMLPADFIDLAEESGLILAMGRWVLRTACAQVALWASQGLHPPRCAVNVSRRQLADDSLACDVQAAVAETGINPDLLELEVTESLLMHDAEHASKVLEQLRTMGVHLAIDDFGIGHSSMAYLKRFPAQTLKIDRSFVIGLPDVPQDAAITRAMIALGHGLGLRIVAEGVENQRQQQALTDMGCDVLQGYHFGRPAVAADLGMQMRCAQRLMSNGGAALGLSHLPTSC